MATLKERIRRLRDGSIKVPQDGINIARAELIGDMIRTGRRYAELTPRERELYEDYTPLAKPVFDSLAADLLGRIRGATIAEQAAHASTDSECEHVDDEPEYD